MKRTKFRSYWMKPRGNSGNNEENNPMDKSIALRNNPFQLRSKWENCMEKVPLPWVDERMEVE